MYSTDLDKKCHEKQQTKTTEDNSPPVHLKIRKLSSLGSNFFFVNFQSGKELKTYLNPVFDFIQCFGVKNDIFKAC